MQHLLEKYRALCLRPLLIDMALAGAVVLCVVTVHVMLTVAQEVHLFRLDFDMQSVALRTSMESTGKDLSSNAYELNVSAQSVVNRLDSQLTDIRLLVHHAAAANQKATEQAIKTSSDVIKDTLNNTSDALQSVADQADKTAAKPVTVTVQPAKEVVEKQPVINIQQPVAPVQKKEKRSRWSRFWHWISRVKD